MIDEDYVAPLSVREHYLRFGVAGEDLAELLNDLERRRFRDVDYEQEEADGVIPGQAPTFAVSGWRPRCTCASCQPTKRRKR